MLSTILTKVQFTSEQDANKTYNETVAQILSVVNTYVIPSICTAGIVVLMVFALINAIRYGKAEEGEAKAKAKKQLIGTVVGIVIMFACVWLLPLLFTFLAQLFSGTGINTYNQYKS